MDKNDLIFKVLDEHKKHLKKIHGWANQKNVYFEKDYIKNIVVYLMDKLNVIFFIYIIPLLLETFKTISLLL